MYYTHMAKHLMVDLETLATTPNATILSMGVVTFDPNSTELYADFYHKIELESFDGLDSFIDDNTIEWWSKQSKKAQEEAFDPAGRIDIRKVLDDFNIFCKGSTHFWSHGSTFDTIIEDLPAEMFPDRPWGPGNNPKTAVWEFLKSHSEFEIDKSIDHKLLISVAPDGYLRRLC